MKFAIVAVLLALLACTVQAYVSKFEYYSAGELRSNYVTLGSQSSNRGFYVFRYQASSKTLNFHVISTLSSVGAVTLNGPYSCYSKIQNRLLNQDEAGCVANTAPVSVKLGQGIVPAAGEDVGFQIFKGSVSLNAVQESMLFRSEYYLLINTVATGSNGKPTDIPSIRARVTIYDHSGPFFSYLLFENNRGQFDRETSKTSNSGFGLVGHSPTTTQLSIRIYSTIKQPGNYVLKCNSGTKTLNQNDNPVEETLDFTEGETPLLLEILLDDSCYIFITSAEAPNGDLYSKFHNLGSLEARSTGAAQDPPVQSPYIAYSLVTFDPSHKNLDILTKHNITDTITAAHVHDANGVLCDLSSNNVPLPPRSYCILNETHLEALENGELYINIHTETNPDGEVRGQLVFNSKQSTALLRSSAGASSSTAVGLGVGLGVGIPILLVAAVGVFFLAKRGGGGGGKI